MAVTNIDNPHGLRAVRTLSGGRPPMTKYTSYTTSVVYEGDVVQHVGSGKVRSLLTTSGTTSGNYIVGVAANYAATNSDIWVYDDPDTIFQVNSDGATDAGESTEKLRRGLNAPLVIATGNTTTKVSKYELDYSGATTDTKNPLKIIGFATDANNAVGYAHAEYEVMLHRHFYKQLRVK